jgi:phosphoglycolate phosphatase-like HAD superfamily hydrolase
MVVKAVFFDFDGTVSDAKGIAFRSIVKTLKEFGYKFSEEKLMELLGVRAEIMFRMLGLRVNNIEEIKNKFYEYFISSAKNGGIRPCVSLKPIWKMKKDGMPIFVVSNSRSDFLRASMKELNILGLFDEIYGSEKFKSKDLILKKLFREMKILPGEAIYVGDRFSDVEFAKKVGCISVAISNRCSFSSRARLEEEKPDYIVRDFYGLKKIVYGLNK